MFFEIKCFRKLLMGPEYVTRLKPFQLHDDDDDDDDGDDEIQSFRNKFYKVHLVDKKTSLRRLDAFGCTRICDNAICISLLYTTFLYIVSSFAIPSFCLERYYFVSLEMCQEIITIYVLLLLQFGHCGTDFTTFFLLHGES